MVEIVLEKLFKVINVPIYKSGLSLGFQVAGYLLLVAGEVTSSHGDPPPKKFLKWNFYLFSKGIPASKKGIFIKSTAIISRFMMITSLLEKTTTF